MMDVCCQNAITQRCTEWKWELPSCVCSSLSPPHRKQFSFGADPFICLHAKLCVTLCDPVDCGPPGSSVHGILQPKILEWIAMPSSRGSSQPRDQTHVSCSSSVAGKFFAAEPPGKPSPDLRGPLTSLTFFMTISSLTIQYFILIMTLTIGFL